MHHALNGLDKLSRAFPKVYALVGNHDLHYRNKRDITSMAMARYLPNFVPIYEPTTFGEGRESVTFLPWLIGEEHKEAKKIKSRYVFGHLELPGFMMNAKVPMPNHGNGVDVDDFNNGPEYVFSGHFHFRQAKDNVIYLGNPFPFNFADVDDEDRGMMFLEWGKEPDFKAWPGQPLFRSFKLSQLLDRPQQWLKPKLTARCYLDIDISYEESQIIKEEYVGKFDLRKLELVNMPRDHVHHVFDDATTFQSVDQIVTEGLLSVQSKDLKPELLLSIYRNLPDL